MAFPLTLYLSFSWSPFLTPSYTVTSAPPIPSKSLNLSPSVPDTQSRRGCGGGRQRKPLQQTPSLRPRYCLPGPSVLEGAGVGGGNLGVKRGKGSWEI